METTTFYIPVFVSAVPSHGDSGDKELVINGYYIFPDYPDGYEDGIIEALRNGDVSSVSRKLDEMRLRNSRKIGFWTVWKINNMYSPATWLGGDEYDNGRQKAWHWLSNFSGGCYESQRVSS